jgi:hypothetical protein
MKKTEGQIIAQEVWNMIPDDAKDKMKGLKKSFMESVAADVDAVVNKISLNLPVSGQFSPSLPIHFGRWILKHAETHTDEDGMFGWIRPNGEEQDTLQLFNEFMEEEGENFR